MLAREFAGLLNPLIAVEELDLKRGLELLSTNDTLGSFDCMLAAAVIRRGLAALVSADSAFRSVDGLTALDAATDLERIFGS